VGVGVGGEEGRLGSVALCVGFSMALLWCVVMWVRMGVRVCMYWLYVNTYVLTHRTSSC
jgi:hypothetical protein